MENHQTGIKFKLNLQLMIFKFLYQISAQYLHVFIKKKQKMCGGQICKPIVPFGNAGRGLLGNHLFYVDINNPLCLFY